MKYLEWIQNSINKCNRRHLKNTEVSLLCSNCTGGILYHWLGLRFNSPFINLYMTENDFLTAMEHFDDFFATPITQCTDSDKEYPVGIGYGGTKIHFMHYK